MVTPHRCDKYLQMLAFLSDCIDPEGYALDLPMEIRQRAARILGLLPAEVAKPAHQESPPA
jgi:hypothetical protein